MCECGGNSFLSGDNLEVRDNDVVCKCGCNSVDLISKDEFSDREEFKYRCSDCNNNITMVRYIDSSCSLYDDD